MQDANSRSTLNSTDLILIFKIFKKMTKLSVFFRKPFRNEKFSNLTLIIAVICVRLTLKFQSPSWPACAVLVAPGLKNLLKFLFCMRLFSGIFRRQNTGVPVTWYFLYLVSK